MKVAILKRNWGKSFEVYQDNVCKHLESYGVVFEKFKVEDKIPDNCELIWTQGTPIIDTFNVIRKARVPIVTTIHGVNQFIVPMKDFVSNRKEWVYWEVKKPVHRLFWQFTETHISLFITVSEYCKHCIQKVYGISPDKIQVIYHGFNPSIFNEDVIPHKNSLPYFLHVSNGKPTKNIVRIIKSFENLCKICPNIELLIVAPLYRGPLTNCPMIKFIDQHRYLSQEELAKLYRGAIGLVFPSIDETFGLPILEAMACGCPVITSNVSACPETACDVALLIDPYNVEQITEAMRRLICEPETRNMLVEKARRHIDNFSWEKSAAEHYKVFRRVLDSKKRKT